MNDTDREENEFPAEDIRPLIEPPSPSILLSCETRDGGRCSESLVTIVAILVVLVVVIAAVKALAQLCEVVSLGSSGAELGRAGSQRNEMLLSYHELFSLAQMWLEVGLAGPSFIQGSSSVHSWGVAG